MRKKPPSNQTTTEPYHIHGKGMLESKRLSNHTFQDLFSVLEFIRIYMMINQDNGKGTEHFPD
jgi:hypothetical protein